MSCPDRHDHPGESSQGVGLRPGEATSRQYGGRGHVVTPRRGTLAGVEFYAVRGEKEPALDWLARAVRNGDERAEWFKRDPLLASIRGQPRFDQILASIDFRRQQRPKRNDG
jgi:hypothetical protein